MSGYVSAELRRFVQLRARDVCEYCLIHHSDTYLGCQVDHVISEKHGGLTIEDNLAYACTFCNRSKGSDLGSISEFTRQLVPFYNPRKQKWFEHFQIRGTTIEAITPTGEVTARILGFNMIERQFEREELIRLERYPSDNAKLLMNSSDS